MGSFTRAREKYFRLICARNEMNTLIGLFRSMAGPSAVPSFFRQRFCLARFAQWPQSESRTRMEPSSRGISTDWPEAGRWSNRSKPGSASSSGIYARMACQGERKAGGTGLSHRQGKSEFPCRKAGLQGTARPSRRAAAFGRQFCRN